MKENRFLELDSLRGIAAVSVCLFHLATTGAPVFNLSIFKYGCTGVDLFFMISGFVIFMSITKAKSLTAFWVARVSRLYPAYWISIIVAVIAFGTFTDFKPDHNPGYILGNLFMVQPLIRAGYLLDTYWTLYVELNFYILISIIWYLKGIDYIENIVFVAVFSVLLMSGMHLLNVNAVFEYFFIALRGIFPLISFFNMFASGIIFYQVYHNGYSLKRVIILIFCFFGIALVHFTDGNVRYFMGVYAHILCFAVYFSLFFLMIHKKLNLLQERWLVFFGTVSYSLYLIHYSLGLELNKYLTPKIGSTMAVLIGFTASLVLSAIVTYTIEKPVLKWSKIKYLNYLNRNKTSEGM